MLLLLLLSLITLLSLTTPTLPSTTTTTTFIYAACSPSLYLPTSPFQSNLNSLLSSLANSASHSPYNTFASSPAYGLYQCRNDLPSPDCSSCVRTAVSHTPLLCPQSSAASLQLDACLLRYSNQNFLGKLDTAVAYTKCSREEAQAGGDMLEFFRRRDAVLDELETGSGFEVSSIGGVEGYAQCVGDLNVGDCKACLAQAVGRIRSACGKALAADLFLEKCWVRFWAAGYYPRAAAAAE